MGASIERRVDLEVVVDPDGLEAEGLRIPGDVQRPLPSIRGVEADVFAIAALGQAYPEVHVFTPPIRYRLSGRRTASSSGIVAP